MRKYRRRRPPKPFVNPVPVSIRYLALITVFVTLCVVVLGAYVRLSDAGLGCPDWPGCYGKIDVPQGSEEIAQANQAYPERPVEVEKAWKEMAHRYLASGVGFLILIMAIVALIKRKKGMEWGLPLVLLGMVIFQGILGMWTVTLLLKPLVVTAHLLGGMTTLSLLVWFTLTCFAVRIANTHKLSKAFKNYVLLCFIALCLQIALGGWVSTNYAALACYGFPQCNTYWWPPVTDFKAGFTLWHGLGVNYEFGKLEAPARIAVHLAHRIGAIVVTVLFVGLVFGLWKQRKLVSQLGNWIFVIVPLFVLQILLGIANVTQGLPLFIATAHNGVAALLLMSMVSLLFLIFKR